MPRPRTYDSRKPVVALPPVQPDQPVGDLPRWEDGKFLHDIKPAAAILSEVLGWGYSVRSLRQRIKDGTWCEGWHWMKTGGRYKISIQRIIDWQAKGSQGVKAATDDRDVEPP
jgi:hypothetical protein